MGHCHRAVQGLNCSVTVAHGLSSKGKNSALLSELSLFGGPKKSFYSRGTKESFVSFLARLTVPISLDDSQSVKSISELLINWPLRRCKNTSLKRGASKPLGTVLTSANFTSTKSARYHLVILIDGYHFWDQILTGHYDHTLEAIWRNENHPQKREIKWKGLLPSFSLKKPSPWFNLYTKSLFLDLWHEPWS